MKKLTVLLILLLAATSSAQMMIGRVDISSPEEIQALRDLGCSVYNAELQGVVDLVFDQQIHQRLLAAGYLPRDLVPLAGDEMDLIDPEYHTYEELTAILQDLELAYPTLCRVDSLGRATQFPRTMWSVKLSDNVSIEEDELALVYLGNHHGNEIVGCETLLYMIGYFLENYGIDPQITQWMNSYEIYFIPMVNPDGNHAVTENINLFWRKNARDNDGDGLFYEYIGSGTWWTQDHEGIDLNRNYDWYWSLGGSSNMWDYDYRGANAFSESENQAVKLLANQRFVTGISFHSYGDVVIAPWTFQGQPAPDQDVLNSVAAGLASHFLKDNGTPFDWYADDGRLGRCPNWFYGLAGTLMYDVEILPYPMFIPPGSQLAERTARYYNGAVYLLERMSGPGITGHVRDALTGQPLAARVEIQGRISTQVKPRFAEPQYGRYTRLLVNGTYTVLAGMPGYVTQRVQNVVVNNTLTQLDINLVHTTDEVDEISSFKKSFIADLRVNKISSGEATFSLNLEQPQYLSLTIYNVRGQEVAQVFDGYRAAGRQEITFTASDLPSGVYFARLAGEGVSQVVKVVLMK